ncbi:MAG: formate dehydrogenase subunit gamma [Betaproteobacteria bacterium]|nr:MAG: formate dehydrogenase subunit gamma [Betaproteobacteria bacterium]
MGQSSAILLRCMLAMTLAALCCAASAQQAASAPASAAMKGPPAGFVAPPEPQPNETNAQRAKTQPGNNAPFWRQVRQSGENEGFSTLPGAEKGVLIQRFVQYPGSRVTNAGEAWRQVRDRWIIPYGGALLFIVLLALALFYWRKGPIGGHEPDTGRQIERFTPFERAAHWTNAIAFVLLAVSGLVMAFGKALLLPLIGHTLFGWLTYALKNIHNFAGPLFAVSLLVVIVTFVRDEMFESADWAWLRRFGGLFGGAEVPPPRFNAGEKVLFWIGALALGVVVVSSGLVLDKLLPGLDYLRGDMQLAHMVHATAAVLMMAAFLGHIYMGTIGMKGAYKAMRHGQVDEAWAKEHHALWYEDIRAGKIPAQRSQPEPPPMTRGA